MLTESGGYQMPSPEGVRLPVLIAEKGTFWSKLRVRGTPGHGSQPYRTDNAIVTAAEVVRRLHEHQPKSQIQDVWRKFVEGMHYPPELTNAFLDPDELRSTLASCRSAWGGWSTRARTRRSRRTSCTAARRPT